uniref:SCP-like protein n=1 Tax=Haemonchus contortus TaxID=6289 RepID=A0A7I4YVC1_HAECO|nr:SCP extracellular domain containing protein [Haemonchus contortus]
MQIATAIACLFLLTPLWAADSYVECPSDNGMTDEVRHAFVDTHNKLRSQTAQGKAKNALGGFAPKAARMLKVSYDCDMEANMMAWTKQCHFWHNPPAERNYWGQNLFSVGDKYYNFTWPSIAETAVISWWQELQVFGVPEDNIVASPNEHKTGHYMQVVWQWTYKIGCAITYCHNDTYAWTIAGCNYNASGDNPGWVVYEMGDPCTTDADCKCAGCVCSKDEALCIPPEYVPLKPVASTTTTQKPTTTTTVPPPNAGSCPGLNNGMTDEARKMFVDKHNEYRSLIAKGQAKGKNGQFAPKAARMLKVNYDCDVEANAMEWAKNCTFGLNTAAMLKRWGNNMNMIPSKMDNKTEAAAASVTAWFSDLQKYGVPENNVFTMNIYTTLSKYSQFAWQSSNRIGCVVVPCWSSWTVVVCEYNPGGDLPNEVIYDVGDPCTKDADCQCSGCVCSRDEALCIAP